MKNHSPEIDFSFSGKRFSVCRKMINRSHASLFLSNLPIYPKEQPFATSFHAVVCIIMFPLFGGRQGEGLSTR